jgi:hypothetical protein
MKFTVQTPFAGRRRTFQPGTYEVPAEMSAIEARCSASEGSGFYDTGVAKPAAEPFREPPRKDFAPENKLRAKAPEAKSAVDGVRGSGDGAKPDSGGRPLMSRPKRNSGE